MPFTTARMLLTGALATAGLGLAAAQAGAAYTPTVQDRTLLITGDAAADKLALRMAATKLPTLELDVGEDGSVDFRVAVARIDRVQVLAGDGNDEVRAEGLPLPTSIDGGAGFDTLSFTGSGADEQFRLAPDGARARLTRNVGAIAIDTGGVERLDVDTLGGADNVTLDDVTGTGVQELRVDLEAVRNGGTADTAADKVILNGTGKADFVNLLGAGTGPTSVIGLPTFVSIQRGDPTRDELTVNTLDGNDRLEAATATAMKLVADGGAGDDTLFGTNGADVLLGRDGRDFVDGQHGADVALLGAGDDTLSWNAGDGSDVVEGQTGADALMMSGSATGERFEASAVGTRVRVSRSTANGAEVVDSGNVERLSAFSFGGADTLVVNDLTGSAVTNVDGSLFDFGVPGGAQDTVVVNGSAAGDTMTVSDDAGIVTVTGAPAGIRLTGTESAGDRLELNGLGGADTIDSTGLSAAEMRLFANGGAGDDVLLGGEGDDIFTGGDGADVVFAGSGDNVALGNAGDDVLRGEEGDDVLDGGAGDDVLIGNAGDDVLLNGEVVFDD